jgi:hypothetical protein
MKLTKVAFGILFSLIIASSFTVNLGEASHVPLITIQSDGSIAPQTEYLKQEGNTYYLTQNLSQTRLVINCSNIVFVGQGYTIDGAHWFALGGKGITLENVKNVTIKDVTVIGYYEPSISITHCSGIAVLGVKTDATGTLAVDISGCIWIEESYGNTITDCVTGVRIQSGSDNIIYRNNVTLAIYSSNNLFYYNNIKVEYSNRENESRPPFKWPIAYGDLVNQWDNGTVGNYWSDYAGQGAYVLDENNTDFHPLKQPVTLQPMLTPTPTPIPELSWLAELPLLLFMLSVALAFRHQRQARNTE